MAVQGQPPTPPPIPNPKPPPPASAGMIPNLPSCAMPTLTQMDITLPFIDTFDTNLSFIRSIKVFVMSFAGYEQLCPQLYQQKLHEYILTMIELYNVAQIPNQLIQNVNTMLDNEDYNLIFDVIDFRHRPGVLAAIIRCDQQLLGTTDMNLDPTVERQDNKQMILQLTFQQLRDFRINNTVITMTLGLVFAGQQQPIISMFDLEFGRIHSEGFYHWIRFSNEEQILLNIAIICEQEQGVTEQWVANFHMHSLIWALWRRLETWRATNYRPLHQSVADHNKSKTVLYRNYVDPNTEEAFWPDQPPATGLYLKKVRFMDLQMGLSTIDYLTDNGCLCSEWCNWIAFFNFNQIYRFLFIRHSQTYLQNTANKPEMYMYSVAIHLYNLRPNLTINMPTPETPLLRLMSNAIDYKERFYSELFLKDPIFEPLYNTSYPPPHTLSGATYMILRCFTPVFDLCYQSDTKPFDVNCVDNFIKYCVNLAKLHGRITDYFVDINEVKNWRKEIEGLQRNIYSQFLPHCCVHSFSQLIIKTELLFDMRTFGTTSTNKIPDDVLEFRKQVVRIGPEGNPLNSSFNCQSAINSLVGCHRLIRKFEETIGKTGSREGVRKTCYCYVTVDQTLVQQIEQIHCDFYVDQQWLTNKNIQQLAIPLTVCFTLKLYAISHDLQKYFSNYMFDLFGKTNQFDALSDFEVIFDNQIVENTIVINHNIILFFFDDDMSTAIDEFYDLFWGDANHRTTANPSSDQCIQSAVIEHNRTYFWWRNGGDQRYRFVQILTTFENILNDVLREADTVLQDYIFPTVLLVQSTYDYTTETLDYLVYYLVKVICYKIFRTTREMHKKIHELEVAPLVASHRMYALSRPGYTPIFRTVRTALATLEAVGQKYALYDDETVRIADAITETQSMVRRLYEKHYYVIGRQFCQEIQDIYQLSHQDMPSPYRSSFGVLHLANGFGFLAAFMNDFRRAYRYVYKEFMRTVFNPNNVMPANMQWRNELQNCRPIIEQYLNDPMAIQMGQPLLHPIWQNNATAIVTHFNTATEQTLNIDLAAADI